MPSSEVTTPGAVICSQLAPSSEERYSEVVLRRPTARLPPPKARRSATPTTPGGVMFVHAAPAFVVCATPGMSDPTYSSFASSASIACIRYGPGRGCAVNVAPPSIDRRSMPALCSPPPIHSVAALGAEIVRMWSVVPLATGVQLAPPSSVRGSVPLLPPAQPVDASTMSMAVSRSAVPLARTTHVAPLSTVETIVPNAPTAIAETALVAYTPNNG